MANPQAVQLGLLSNAIAEFERKLSDALGALGEVQERAAPIAPYDADMKARFNALGAAAQLGLSEHYRTAIVPAVKGA